MRIYCDGSGGYYCFQVDGEAPEVFANPLGATHNESEYLAILAALFWCAKYRTKIHTDIEIVSDSEWAVKQINGEYRVKDRRFLLPQYLCQWMMVYCGIKVTVSWIHREENLAGQALEKINKEVSKCCISRW